MLSTVMAFTCLLPWESLCLTSYISIYRVYDLEGRGCDVDEVDVDDVLKVVVADVDDACDVNKVDIDVEDVCGVDMIH